MRKIIFSIIIGIFFCSLFLYLVDNLSPWNMNAVFNYLNNYNISHGADFNKFVHDAKSYGIIFDFLNIGNVTILFIIGASAFIGIFSAVHMSIDKLFFKTFWQEPDYKVAIRRGLWLSLLFIIFSSVRFLGGLSSINILFIIFSVCMIAYIEISLTRGRRPVIEENKDVEQSAK